MYKIEFCLNFYTDVRNNNLESGYIVKAVATVCLPDDYTLKESNIEEILPLKYMKSIKGNGLSLSNGGVLIGTGIEAVIVCGEAYFFTGTMGAKNIAVYKNTDIISRHNIKLAEPYKHIGVPMRMVPVPKGDLISLRILGEKGDVIKSYTHGTFLSIIAI